MGNLQVTYLTEDNENQWNNLVEQHPLGSFYHKYEWLKTVEKGLGHQPYHIVVTKNGNPIGGLPNFASDVEKTPFKGLYSFSAGVGGPIITSKERECLDLIFEEVKKICKQNNLILHTVATGNLGYIRYGKYFSNLGYKPILRGCKVIIELNKPYEELKMNFSKARRYDLKKAEDSPIEIEDMDITIPNLKKFYKIYTKVIIEKHSSTPYLFTFFKELKENLNDNLKLFMASYNDKYVGGFMHFLGKKESTIYHYFGTVLEEYFKYYPTELLHEYSIKWAIRNEYKIYDMGGTGSSFEEGIFKFKTEFGGKPIPYLQWEKGYSILKWNLFRLGRYFYRKSRD